MKKITAERLRRHIKRDASLQPLSEHRFGANLWYTDLHISGPFFALPKDTLDFAKCGIMNLCFKNCIFDGSFLVKGNHLNDIRIPSIVLIDCVFKKNVQLRYCEQVYLQNVNVKMNIHIHGQLERVRLENIRTVHFVCQSRSYEISGKTTKETSLNLTGPLEAQSIAWEIGDAKVRIETCHVSMLGIAAHFFPNVPIEKIFTDKGKRLII